MRQEEDDVLQYIRFLVTIMAGVCSVGLFYMQVFFDFFDNHFTKIVVKGEIT
jgi:ABC-type phosphate transport system permease subunit